MKNAFVLFFTLVTSIYFSAAVSAQGGLNIHIGEHGIDIQPDAFMSYYQSPPDRISWLQSEKIPETQWPLLFEIARAGNVTPDRVWEMRRQRSSWYDVLDVLNISPSYFYYDVPVEQRLSALYDRAYRYYREHPTETMRWSDDDLVGLASVKYLSDSTHRPVHESVVIYQSHPHFIHSTTIQSSNQHHNQGHNKYKKQKAQSVHHDKPAKDNGKKVKDHGQHDKSKNQGKHNGHKN